jgi:hypothetical protein
MYKYDIFFYLQKNVLYLDKNINLNLPKFTNLLFFISLEYFCMLNDLLSEFDSNEPLTIVIKKINNNDSMN